MFYPPDTKSFDGFIGQYVCSRIRYVIVSDQDTIYDVIIFPIMILCKVMLL